MRSARRILRIRSRFREMQTLVDPKRTQSLPRSRQRYLLFFFLLLSNPNPWICFALGSGFFSFLYFSHDFRMQKRMKRKLQGQLISCSRLEFLVQMVAEPLHLVFLFPFLRNLGCIWMFFILWLVWMAAGKLGIRLEYLGLFGIVSDLLLCFCFRNLCFLKHFSFLNRNRRVTFGMNTLKWVFFIEHKQKNNVWNRNIFLLGSLFCEK